MLGAETCSGDYRGGGTVELYRAVSSGELPPLSLDTPSFAALEEMVVRLTQDESFLMDKWLQEIQRVWGQRRCYAQLKRKNVG